MKAFPCENHKIVDQIPEWQEFPEARCSEVPVDGYAWRWSIDQVLWNENRRKDLWVKMTIGKKVYCQASNGRTSHKMSYTARAELQFRTCENGTKHQFEVCLSAAEFLNLVFCPRNVFEPRNVFVQTQFSNPPSRVSCKTALQNLELCISSA